jgi:uncharacterized short protein YbdD (DUF466 family)
MFAEIVPVIIIFQILPGKPFKKCMEFFIYTSTNHLFFKLLIGIPDFEQYDGLPEVNPGWEIPVKGYFNDPGAEAKYLNDYGDSWQPEWFYKDLVQFDNPFKRWKDAFLER